MSQNNPLPGGEVALFEAPDGQIRLDVRLERDTVRLTQARMTGRDEESNVQILHILRKSGYSGIDVGGRVAARGFRATVAKNATTAICGITRAVECRIHKAAETVREWTA